MLILVLITLALLMVVIAGLATQTRVAITDAQERGLRSAASTEVAAALSTGTRLLDTEITRMLRSDLSDLLDGRAAWYLGDRAAAPQRIREFGAALQGRVDSVMCGVGVRVYVSGEACGEALEADLEVPLGRLTRGAANAGLWAAVQSYEVPFLMVARSDQDGVLGRQVTRGVLLLRLGQGSLASFALIEGEQGQAFDSVTVLRGDVHVNAPVRISGRPRFMGLLSSASCTGVSTASCTGASDAGIELSGGFERLEDLIPHPSAPCYPSGECPQLEGGMDLEAGFVSLEAPPLRNAAATAGLLVSGDRDFTLEVITPDALGEEGTAWTMCASPAVCETYFRSDRAPAVLRKLTGGVWSVVRSDFNGVVFVDGALRSLRAATPFTAALSEQQLSVAASGSITLQGTLRLANPACTTQTEDQSERAERALCLNSGAQGLLGLVSLTGNLIVAEDAPANLDVSAAVLLPQGGVRFADGGAGRRLSLLGALAARHGYAQGAPMVVEYDDRLYAMRPAGFASLNRAQFVGVAVRLEGVGE